MVKSIILAIFIFYGLILLQTSFLINFKFYFHYPINLVLIVAILINFLNIDWRKKLIFSFIGGFLLDIFLLGQGKNFFGFYLLILLTIFCLTSVVFKKYLRYSWMTYFSTIQKEQKIKR